VCTPSCQVESATSGATPVFEDIESLASVQNPIAIQAFALAGHGVESRSLCAGIIGKNVIVKLGLAL